MDKDKSNSNESDSDRYISEGALSQKLLEDTKTTIIHKEKSRSKDVKSHSKNLKNKKRNKPESKIDESSATDEEPTSAANQVADNLNNKINSKFMEAAGLSTKKGLLQKYLTNSNNVANNLIHMKEKKDSETHTEKRKFHSMNMPTKASRLSFSNKDLYLDTSISNILSSTQLPKSKDVSVSFMELGKKHSPIMKMTSAENPNSHKNVWKKSQIVSTSESSDEENNELQQKKSNAKQQKKRKVDAEDTGLSLIKSEPKKNSSSESRDEEYSRVQIKKQNYVKNKAGHKKVKLSPSKSNQVKKTNLEPDTPKNDSHLELLQLDGLNKELSQRSLTTTSKEQQITVKNPAINSSESSDSGENKSYILTYLQKRKKHHKSNIKKLVPQQKLLKYKSIQVKNESSSDSESSEVGRNKISIEELRNKLNKIPFESPTLSSHSESDEEPKSLKKTSQEVTVTKHKTKELSNVSDTDYSETVKSKLFIKQVSKLDKTNESENSVSVAKEAFHQSSSESNPEGNRIFNIDVKTEEHQAITAKENRNKILNNKSVQLAFDDSELVNPTNTNKKINVISKPEKCITKNISSSVSGVIHKRKNLAVSKNASTSEFSCTDSEDDSKTIFFSKTKNTAMNILNKSLSATQKKISKIQSSSKSDTDYEDETRKNDYIEKEGKNKSISNLYKSPSKPQKKNYTEQSSSESDSEKYSKNKRFIKEEEKNKSRSETQQKISKTQLSSESDSEEYTKNKRFIKEEEKNKSRSETQQKISKTQLSSESDTNSEDESKNNDYVKKEGKNKLMSNLNKSPSKPQKKSSTTQSNCESYSAEESKSKNNIKEEEKNKSRSQTRRKISKTQSSSESDTDSEDASIKNDYIKIEDKTKSMCNLNKSPSKPQKKIYTAQSSCESEEDSKNKKCIKEEEKNKSRSKTQQKICKKQSSSESGTDSVDGFKKTNFIKEENNKSMSNLNKSQEKISTTQSSSELDTDSEDDSKKKIIREEGLNNKNKSSITAENKISITQSSSESDTDTKDNSKKKLTIKEETKNHSLNLDSDDSSKIRKNKNLNDVNKMKVSQINTSNSECGDSSSDESGQEKSNYTNSSNQEHPQSDDSDRSVDSSKQPKKKKALKKMSLSPNKPTLNSMQNSCYDISSDNDRKLNVKELGREGISSSNLNNVDRSNTKVKTSNNSLPVDMNNIKDCMKDFMISNSNLEPLNKRTIVTLHDLSSDEEAWLVQVPKVLTPEILLGQKLTFKHEDKLKLKVAGLKYQYETNNKNSNICVLGSKSIQNPLLAAKIISVSGTLIIHQMLKGNSTLVKKPIKTKVELPLNLKIRHPIFGSEFQHKIDLDSSISSKLLDAEIAKRKANSNIIKNKQKSLQNKAVIKDNKNEIIFELLNQSKNALDLNVDSIIKKKKKRKCSESFDEPMNLKRVKKEVFSEDDIPVLHIDSGTKKSKKIKKENDLRSGKRTDKTLQKSDLIKELLGQKLTVLESETDIAETKKKKRINKNVVDHILNNTVTKGQNNLEETDQLLNTSRDIIQKKHKMEHDEPREQNENKKLKKKKEKKNVQQLDLTNYI